MFVGLFFPQRFMPMLAALSQDLQARVADEDENAFVHDAAKQSLNRRGATTVLGRSLDSRIYNLAGLNYMT